MKKEEYNINTKVGIERIDKLFNSIVIPLRYREEKAFKDGIDGLKHYIKNINTPTNLGDVEELE